MTPITDKIKNLPDGYVFEATPWTRIDSPVNDGFLSGKHVEFNTDDLKALVSELERKTRALQHYANPKNWCQQVSEVDGCPLDDFDVMLGNGNGYDIAQAALEGKE